MVSRPGQNSTGHMFLPGTNRLRRRNRNANKRKSEGLDPVFVRRTTGHRRQVSPDNGGIWMDLWSRTHALTPPAESGLHKQPSRDKRIAENQVSPPCLQLISGKRPHSMTFTTMSLKMMCMVRPFQPPRSPLATTVVVTSACRPA